MWRPCGDCSWFESRNRVVVLTLLVPKGRSCHHLLPTLQESLLPAWKICLQVFGVQEGLSLEGI